MRTTKVLLLLAVSAVLVLGFSACGQQGGGDDASKAAKKAEEYSSRAAMLGGPNVNYVNPGQYKCPVTGKKLNPEYYASTDEGRVYFNSQEAKQKFQNNPEQYIPKVKQQQ